MKKSRLKQKIKLKSNNKNKKRIKKVIYTHIENKEEKLMIKGNLKI